MRRLFGKNCEEWKPEQPLTELPPEDLNVHSPIANGEHFGTTPPAEVGTPEYDEEWGEAAACVDMVKTGQWPGEFLAAQGLNPEVPEPLKEHVEVDGVPIPILAAETVHMDKPLDLAGVCIGYLIDNGAELRDQYKVTSNVDFLGMVQVYALMGMAIAYSMNRAFSAKWFWMGLRPENRFGKWLAARFSTYPEGCPPHPRHPAGHGTVSGVVKAMCHIMFDIERGSELSNTINETCGHFAQYRTFSGVHHARDNTEGMDLGERKADEFMVKHGQTCIDMLCLAA